MVLRAAFFGWPSRDSVRFPDSDDDVSRCWEVDVIGVPRCVGSFLQEKATLREVRRVRRINCERVSARRGSVLAAAGVVSVVVLTAELCVMAGGLHSSRFSVRM